MSTGSLVREQLSWERDFTQIPNTFARDKRLSWCARGILLWLMTHHNGFEVTMQQIEASSWKEGREAVRSAIAELEKIGYLRRHKKRGRGGRLAGYIWHLQDPFEEVGETLSLPVDNSTPTGDGFPSDGAPEQATGGRLAVDGNPSTKKNTNLRTSKDPAQPQSRRPRPVDSFGVCGHPLIDDRHCERGCPASAVRQEAS